MVGHLAEAGVVIHDDFRAGNVAPASANLDFVKACEARLPQGHTLTAVRADSASYQADLFNYCEETGKTFAIGGRLDAPTLAAIAAIPDAAWTHYADCAVAETVHSMEATHKAFRLIVGSHVHQGELLEEDRPRYHVIASNRSGSTADVLIWMPPFVQADWRSWYPLIKCCLISGLFSAGLILLTLMKSAERVLI
jgi:hypothetical protein